MEEVKRKIRFRLKWDGKIYKCPEHCLSLRDRHIYTNIPRENTTVKYRMSVLN